MAKKYSLTARDGSCRDPDFIVVLSRNLALRHGTNIAFRRFPKTPVSMKEVKI
jgi:hypothetical protein